MKKLFISLLVLLVLLVGAIVAVPFLVPTDVIRDQVVAQVKSQTGRDLKIAGKTSFGIFPDLGVTLTKVTLSDPPNMKKQTMLKMDELNVSVKFWPLLGREIEVDRFILRRPQISLRVDKKGRKNWDFKAVGQQTKNYGSKRTASKSIDPLGAFIGAAFAANEHATIVPAADTVEVAETSASDEGKVVSSLKSFRLTEVQIIAGTLVYDDRLKGQKQNIKQINLTATQAGNDAPLKSKGSLIWQREKVSFDAVVPSLATFNSQGHGPVKVSVSTRHGKALLDGDLRLSNGFKLAAKTTAETSSLGRLTKWLGSPLPHSMKSLKTASVSGSLTTVPEKVSFDNAVFSLQDMTAKGKLAIVTKGPRPYIRAALRANLLNLNHFTGSPGSPKADKSQAQKTAKPAKGDAIGRLVGSLDTEEKTKRKARAQKKARRKKPAKTKSARGAKWDTSPLPLEGLSAANADLTLQTDKIIHQKFKTGKGVLQIALNGGKLKTTLKRLDLYNGRATGKIMVDGAASVPRISITMNVKKVDAKPMLKDIAQFERLSGQANMNFSVSGTGKSQYKIVKSLKGSGKARFTDGAIEGFDIAKMLRGLNPANLVSGLSGKKADSGGKTNFSSLSSSFVIKKGIVTLPKKGGISLLSPLLRIKAHGTISLPPKQLDIFAKPKLVASLRGQGGNSDVGGIEIPVRLVGPWENPKPKIDPKDLLGVAGGNLKSIDGIGAALKGIKKGRINSDSLGGLLGGGKGGGDALNNLFK